MPHTNRKKKTAARSKRVQVEDEDGWTRVTTDAVLRRLEDKAPVSGNDYNPTHEPLTDPRSITLLPTYKSSEIPKGASLQTAQAAYEKCEKAWLASESYNALENTLRAYLSHARQIKEAVIFGSGSFSGVTRGWIERHSVALTQLAVFVSAVRIIRKSYHNLTSYSSSQTIRRRTAVATRLLRTGACIQ